MEEDRSLQIALEQAEAFKIEGNEALTRKEYTEAIRLYGQAIDLDPENAVYFSNRSAAYLAEGSIGKALKDAEKSVSLKPDWAKAYSRLGAAQYRLTRYEAARESYFKALRLDPDNKTIEESLEIVREAQDRHSQLLKEKYKREEEAIQAEKELKEKAEKEVAGEDELLNQFMNEVEQIQVPTECNIKDESKKPLVDFGNSNDQISRLTQPHYEWINLNPFNVLMLDIDASVDDINQHYRKISSLVHPDKNLQNQQARTAYEEVKKAHVILLDEGKRKTCAQIIQNTTEKTIKERKAKLKKGIKLNMLSDEEEEIKKNIMAKFAENENRRRNYEQREAKQRRREGEAEFKEREKMLKDMKQEKEWAKVERREKRVGNWRDFQHADSKKKKVDAHGWKPEARDKEFKHGQVENDNYKKKWK